MSAVFSPTVLFAFSLETIGLLTTLILAILTGIYVFLTYFLVRQSKRANELNQEAIREQFRILTAPYMNCSVAKDGDKAVLTLSNTGRAPSHDVDLFAIAIYDEDYESSSDFVEKYLREEDRDYPLTPDEEGFYGVRDRVAYYMFFHGRMVTVELAFPYQPDMINVLLQYRDTSGDNFSQVYLFYTRGSGDSYHLGYAKPGKIAVQPRVDMALADALRHETRLETEEGQALPKHMADEFQSMFEHSVASGMLKDFYLIGIEDRGEWRDI